MYEICNLHTCTVLVKEFRTWDFDTTQLGSFATLVYACYRDFRICCSPLIEPPSFDGLKVLLTDLLENVLQSDLGSGQLRSVGNVEAVAAVLQRLAACLGLLDAGLAQVGIIPKMR